MTPVQKALAITAGIIAIPILIGMAGGGSTTGAICGLLVLVLATSIWAALDSTKLKKYKTGLPNPVVLFIGFVILWIFYFPNYLTKKFKVEAGEIGLKKAYRTDVADAAVAGAATASSASPSGPTQTSAAPAEVRSNVSTSVSGKGGSGSMPIFVGGAIGAVIGFLLRPSVPLIGQLPLGTVLTRGGNLSGLDSILKGAAETSCNYMIVGALIGAVVGWFIQQQSAKKA